MNTSVNELSQSNSLNSDSKDLDSGELTPLHRVNEDESLLEEQLVKEHLHDKSAPKDYRDLAEAKDEAEE